MELLALPYRPNRAEYLALTHSGRILGDQMAFLSRFLERKPVVESARTRLRPLQPCRIRGSAAMIYR